MESEACARRGNPDTSAHTAMTTRGERTHAKKRGRVFTERARAHLSTSRRSIHACLAPAPPAAASMEAQRIMEACAQS